jgi:hypothetical protein
MTAHMMFKYAIKTELTRKYYERRLKRFFDFIEFETNINEIEGVLHLQTGQKVISIGH